jgi:hypothetical protein
MARSVCSAAMAAELVNMLVIGSCPEKDVSGTCRSEAGTGNDEMLHASDATRLPWAPVHRS